MTSDAERHYAESHNSLHIREDQQIALHDNLAIIYKINPHRNEQTRPPYPKILYSPVYPEELVATKVEGEVLVKYVINEKGKVQDVEIISSPNELFAETVTAALKKSVFFPSAKDGKLVSTRIQQKFPFSLQPVGGADAVR